MTEVVNEPGGIRIALEDRATLGGTSKIQLYFDAEMKTCRRWRITDPQGYLTTVQLSNLQRGKAVDGSLSSSTIRPRRGQGDGRAHQAVAEPLRGGQRDFGSRRPFPGRPSVSGG